MKYCTFTNSDIIEKSRELIHAFMHRELIPFTDLLSEQFVWLGDSSAQYIVGKENFLKTITAEILMPPLELSQEEYSILTHERHTWVAYGRCVVTTGTAEDVLLSSGIHFTFVWKQEKDTLFLLMACANHVQDEQPSEDTSSVPQARVFDHVKQEILFRPNTPKIRLRNQDGSQYFLYPDEIIYVQSQDKYCTIYTKADQICCYMPLKSLEQSGFIRIHSRYLVNMSYIASIKRYEINLLDGRKLPIGKNRYQAIKEIISSSFCQ